MSGAFDVVVVPDFRGERVTLFGPRTLFFLAAWREYGGRTASVPLHLACIGEPPPSVRWLAERCGAGVSIHPPLVANRGQTQNKLRGLEVEGRSERVLLLDADVLALADCSELGELGAGVAAAAGPGFRVPDAYWEKIYAALGLPTPTESTGFRRRGRAVAFPYYNSGVLLAPWGCGLRPLWEDHLRRITALYDERDPYREVVHKSDQTALSTALQALRQRGVAITNLPAKFNGHVRPEFRRGLRISEIALFHAVGFLRWVPPGPRFVERGLQRYRARLLRGFLRRYCLQVPTPAHIRRLGRDFLPTLIDIRWLGRRLDRLYRKYVAEALRQDTRVSA